MEFGPILRAMGRNKVRFGLVVLEVALTLALVANCVNLIQETRKTLARPSGFADDDIVSVESTPFTPEFREQPFRDAAVGSDLAALRAIPGVAAASNTRFRPWQGGGSSTELRVADGKGPALRTQIYNADDATLASLGVAISEGRDFAKGEALSETLRMRAVLSDARPLGEDGTPKEKVSQDVIVSRAYAKLAFPEGSPLGKRLQDTDGDQYQIVGVFDRFYNPYGWPIHEYATFFASLSHSYEFGMRYLVRAAPGQRAAVEKAIEKTLLSVNRGRQIRVRPLVEIRTRYQAGDSLLITILWSVIALLVVVTGLGIVGLTAFSVAERTRQIGTRRALGAEKRDILRFFLLENWIVTTLGLSIGVLAAYAINVVLVTKAGAAKMDPSVVVLGILFLWATGLVATLLPALRAARVAPAIATRNV